ncbi:MAG: flavin reductase family protein [Ilumatobacteraceae bacterium]
MSPIDPARFRNVLGHFPTGVTVVTGMDDDSPVGLTIGSFTSVSLDPPMVGFLPGTNSASWAAMAPSRRFGVNVLGSDQADVCWTFAKSGNEAERFTDLAWHPGVTGSPVIEGSLATIECEVEAVTEMGDHYFVLGRVVALDAGEGAPLLFFRGGLGGFAPA